ncbi:RagB/SusD family nutrient uptake outer membrane protein [Christiangramia forsetii]|uniref:SusD/RagB family protein n=2 Tax=Christiangramia forsetii TaxID=411153 RepID=A0M5H3_CHRFK|nr:RagB/SusD family nutrient uptake outer membrane protein [Christiangramia forsetii]GGG32941.1 membrane protein [Christiangramia forsetii]CAL67868.1 SusD/RagB family protein [Christiangramia forsetii KT0803]
MKRIQILIGAFVGLLLFSCNDAIEIEQPGRLPADAAFETVDDLESGLFGVYNNINLAPEIAFNAIFTDELAIGFDNGGQGISDYGFNLNPSTPASSNFWIRNYALINSANRLIDAAIALEPAAGEQDRYDDILGQAYAIRAFGHFQLQSYYTTDYTDDSALGVILVDFVPTIDQNLLRNTNGEVFGLIESDLDRAESLLSTESATTFISQDFITAFRARMAAYRQNYDVAEANASELLEKYGLATQEEYPGIFADTSNAEIIFKLERTIGDSYDVQGPTGTVATTGWIGARFAFVGPGFDGSPYFEAGRSLFNLVDTTDVRYDVLFDETSIIDPDYASKAGGQVNDVLIVDKYAGSEGRPLMNDLKVFRSSEMLLILAEAYAAQGNFNGDSNSTASLIKRMRDARLGEDTTLPSYAGMQEAFADILEERRVELAFEGHRYKDLKRLGERANRGVLKDPVDCAFNGACTLSPTDYRFTLPLPLVEFNANPGLRDQQNPGY